MVLVNHLYKRPQLLLKCIFASQGEDAYNATFYCSIKILLNQSATRDLPLHSYHRCYFTGLYKGTIILLLLLLDCRLIIRGHCRCYSTDFQGLLLMLLKRLVFKESIRDYYLMLLAKLILRNYCCQYFIGLFLGTVLNRRNRLILQDCLQIIFYRLCMIFCYILTNLFSFYIYYFLDVNKIIDVLFFELYYFCYITVRNIISFILYHLRFISLTGEYLFYQFRGPLSFNNLKIWDLNAIFIQIFIMVSFGSQINLFCHSENEVVSMVEFVIDNIFVEFGGIFSRNHQHPHQNKLCPSPYISFPFLL